MTTTVSLCVHSNTLKLCFYDSKRYYKAVTKNLVGKFHVSNWDDKKRGLNHPAPIQNETIAY
jgi:hypothetical protein